MTPYAVLPLGGTLGAVTPAATTSPAAALAVTVVLLLVLSAVLWSFLRRARRGGVLPLDVDRGEPPRLPEPLSPDLLPGEVAPSLEAGPGADEDGRAPDDGDRA